MSICAQAFPTPRLRFGEHDSAFLHAIAPIFDHVIGGGRPFEDADVATNDFRFAEARQ